MNKKLFPITRDNFEEVTKYVQDFAKKNAKGKLLRKIIVPASGIVFLVLSLLMTYGLFYSMSTEEEMFIFDKFQKITEMWNMLSVKLVDPARAWYINFLACILTLYLAPFVVTLLITIVVNLIYLKKEETVTGNSAKELYQLAKKASGYYEYTDSSTSSTWFASIYVLTVAALLIYAFVLLQFPVAGVFGMALGMLIALAIVFFVYKLLFKATYYLNTVFCKTKYGSDIVSVTDKYWLSVDPEEKKRREEEEAARRAESARAKEQAARDRKRALELEKQGEYDRAKELFLQAARGGDALGMENYARHCVIAGNRRDAIYWMQKCVDTGEADDLSRRILNALKNGENIDAHYN